MEKLLLEIGTEELPSGYVSPAVNSLKEIIKKKFEQAVLPHGNITLFATPRRIALIVEDLPEKQEKRTNKVSGPPKKIAVDEKGKPTKAGLGFAKKQGKTFEEVQFESTPKGEYCYLMVEEGGGDTVEVLKTILPKAFGEIPFPKTMRWGNGDATFARPVRSIVAMLGKRKIDFSFHGISSGNTTFGLRFISDGPITLDSADSYESTLEAAGLYVDPKKRQEIIRKAFDKIEESPNTKVVRDGELVETICYLTEIPVAVLGGFDESYLDLPRELLITVMKHHQRYFSVEGSDGAISNRFVAFSNIDCEDISLVRRGYERVLSARLSDARFFFDEDKKEPLSHFAKKLSGVTYIKGLGTVADKTERIVRIAGKIAKIICPEKLSDVEAAAKLCKADLTTLMVYEFPELQGIMGREYAKARGYNETVASAMDEHYLPRFSGDDLPSSKIAQAVALADKIDTISGCFSLGLIPTGSEDPFSLRRHALGIIRILLAGCEGLSLFLLIRLSIESLPIEGKKSSDVRDEVYNFFAGRIKNNFVERGFSHDVVDAVLAADMDNMPGALKRCEAVAEMKKEEHSENLAIGFKRAANIVKSAEESLDADEAVLTEKVELELLKSLKEREKNLKPLMQKKDYKAALKEIALIRSSVDSFFDGVMVMAEDTDLRNSRLNLLRRVTRLFTGLADFSKLVF